MGEKELNEVIAKIEKNLGAVEELLGVANGKLKHITNLRDAMDEDIRLTKVDIEAMEGTVGFFNSELEQYRKVLAFVTDERNRA